MPVCIVNENTRSISSPIVQVTGVKEGGVLMRASRFSTSLLAGTLALLLRAGGCDDGDDPPTQCDPSPLATLTGRLLGPTGPLRGQVCPLPVDAGDPPRGTGLQERAFAGEDGRFSLCLAPGRYQLSANPDGTTSTYYAAGGCVPSLAQADTVMLTQQGLDLDVRWGALRLDVSLPGHDDGSTIRAAATLVDGSWLDWYGVEAEIEQERATLQLEGLPAGPFQVMIWFPGDERRPYWYPHARESAQAETLLAAIGQQLQIEDAWPGRVRLSSAIHGCWPRIDPSEAPRVRAVGQGGENLVWTYAESDGDFTLDLVLPEPLRIEVMYGGYSSWLGGEDYEHAEWFELPAGTHTRDPYVVGGLMCRFEEPGPAPGEEIELTLMDLRSGLFRHGIAVVSAAGEVGIPLLPAGTYALQLRSVDSCPGWLPQWFDRASTRAGATHITIHGPSDVVEIGARMARAGALAGIISRRGGTFLGHAYVVACDAADSTAHIVDAEPDPVTGAFCLGGLEDGAYRLRLWLWMGSERVSWYPGTNGFAEAETLVIEDGAAVTGLAWEVAP